MLIAYLLILYIRRFQIKVNGLLFEIKYFSYDFYLNLNISLDKVDLSKADTKNAASQILTLLNELGESVKEIEDLTKNLEEKAGN